MKRITYFFLILAVVLTIFFMRPIPLLRSDDFNSSSNIVLMCTTFGVKANAPELDAQTCTFEVGTTEYEKFKTTLLELECTRLIGKPPNETSKNLSTVHRIVFAPNNIVIRIYNEKLVHDGVQYYRLTQSSRRSLAEFFSTIEWRK